MKNIPITVSLLLAAATLVFSPSSAEEPAGAVPPDFTAGGKRDDSHDWLLGPTGLRGWMFLRHEDLTATSRQILVTAVDKGSPADGIVQVKEQAWYYDLSRNWKGGFVYQKIEAGEENDNYTDWDLTGAYLLSFGLYHKSLYILGKKPSAAPALNAEAVKKVIAAGRDWFPKGEHNGYYKRNDEELIEGLKSWSPVVRYHSAEAIGKRGGDFAPTLIAMLDGKERYARYGAAEALGRLGNDASSALPKLRATLKDPDTWLTCLAAEALTRLGDKDSLGDLFALSLRPTPSDPRRMHQRAASRALFAPYPGKSEPRSLLSDSLDGVDRALLHQVMKSFLQNDDSVVRASIIPVLGKTQ